MDAVRIVVIPDERPMSWNRIYSCPHWTVRRDEASRVHQIVRAVLDPDLPKFSCRVDIETVVYFKSSPLDPCNIADKIYIDGFIGWYLEDDDRRYVRTTSTRSEIDQLNPRVVITFTPVLQEEQNRDTRAQPPAVRWYAIEGLP